MKLLSEGLSIEVEDLIILKHPNDEVSTRKGRLLLHGSPFFGLIIPFGNVLFPLFLWISKAEGTKFTMLTVGQSLIFTLRLIFILVISLLLFLINFFASCCS